uniref:DNA 3'-5' helicase n=1 Tax=Setaria digitata TaxID=48799 RepID=A0A915PB57_9BILA
MTSASSKKEGTTHISGFTASAIRKSTVHHSIVEISHERFGESKKVGTHMKSSSNLPIECFPSSVEVHLIFGAGKRNLEVQPSAQKTHISAEEKQRHEQTSCCRHNNARRQEFYFKYKQTGSSSEDNNAWYCWPEVKTRLSCGCLLGKSLIRIPFLIECPTGASRFSCFCCLQDSIKNMGLTKWFSISFIHLVMVVDGVFLGDSIYYAVNCGGSAHTDINGVHYQADPLRIGIASDFGSRLSIMRVDPRDAILYQTERYHTADFTYTVPVPKEDGEYTLVLKFCEVYFQSSQQKVFDVLLNDEVMIAELDIFKEADGIGIAYDRLLTFHIKNGDLLYANRHDSSGYIKITLAKGVLDNPKLNAFYIYRGPKTDIPPLRDISYEEDIMEEEEELDEEVDVKLRSELNRFEDERLVEDPYAEQETSHMFIPFLIAFACFFPVLFCLSSSGSEESVPPAHAIRLLKKFFGYSTFRSLQWTVIQNALSRRDQIVVMSTGYGKSVCYQLPSLYTGKLTIVISPLISLMNDQVENLRSNGIQAVCINSEVKVEEQRSFLTSNNLRLLYTTPEFALHNRSLFESVRENVSLLAIDEAHCVSQWGHEFRPSYRQLAEIRCVLGNNVPVMALTATATREVRIDIAKSLELHQPIITRASLDRPNLYLSVRTPTSLEGLLCLLEEEDEKNGKHFRGSTIIYCPTRNLVDEIYEYLSKKGMKCGKYHAGMSVVSRRKTHEYFIKDRITTIIATVAFGMGIHKPDVRNVIHYGAPKNIESYYQEIGRAGRDGCPSKCTVFFKDQELAKHRYCLLRDKSLKEEYKKHQIEMLSSMERFLHATSCRRFQNCIAGPQSKTSIPSFSLLLSHFGESAKKDVTCTGCCDVCDQLISFENNAVGCPTTNLRDYGNEAAILLRAVVIFEGCTGLRKKTNVIQGKQKSVCYGSGKHKTEAFWKELGRVLRMNGYITEKKSPFNNFAHLISLSDKGQNWLYGINKELYLEPTPLLIGQIRINDKHYISLSRSSEPLRSKILNFAKQRTWKDCSCYDELIHLKMDTASEQLEKILFEVRTNLAIEHGCGAHIIASNKCIRQLAMIRPSCIQNLSVIREVTEEKQLKFGQKFVDAVVEFCAAHNVSVNCTISSTLPEEIQKRLSTLNQACADVYLSHIREKLSLDSLSTKHAVSEGTVASYFVNFVKNGLPIYLEVVGINRQHMDVVCRSVREYGSDILRMKPIMEALPEDFIDYSRLKIIFAILEYEYGIVGDSEETSRNVISTNFSKRKILNAQIIVKFLHYAFEMINKVENQLPHSESLYPYSLKQIKVRINPSEQVRLTTVFLQVGPEVYYGRDFKSLFVIESSKKHFRLPARKKTTFGIYLNLDIYKTVWHYLTKLAKEGKVRTTFLKTLIANSLGSRRIGVYSNGVLTMLPVLIVELPAVLEFQNVLEKLDFQEPNS